MSFYVFFSNYVALLDVHFMTGADDAVNEPWLLHSVCASFGKASSLRGVLSIPIF
jgi:hypothetical protein